MFLLSLASVRATLTVTDRGTGGNSTAATTVVASPTGTMAVGSTAVLCLAADNANAPSTNVSASSFTDSVGNTWYKYQEGIGGTANTAVDLYFFASRLTSAITTSDTITVTFTASVTAKAWTLSEISSSAGYVLPAALNIGTTSNTNAPTNATSTNLSNGAVIIGFGGAESADTWIGDADTTRGNWSTKQSVGFGTGATGMSVISQSKVVTATGTQSFDPTLTITDVRVGTGMFFEVDSRARSVGGSNGSTASVSATARLPLAAGSLAVFCIAADNAGTSGTTQNLPSSLTDSGSNTWTLRQTGIFSGAALNAGVELGIYSSVLTTGLAVGDSVTCTFSLSSVTAKDVVLWEFSNSTGYNAGGVGTGATTGTPSVTTGSITSPNYVVGVAGLEGQDSFAADADTSNGAWSLESSFSAGTSATGMAISSQYKATTASGAQTYNPTCSVGDTMIAWAEFTVPSVSPKANLFLNFFP